MFSVYRSSVAMPFPIEQVFFYFCYTCNIHINSVMLPSKEIWLLQRIMWKLDVDTHLRNLMVLQCCCWSLYCMAYRANKFSNFTLNAYNCPVTEELRHAGRFGSYRNTLIDAALCMGRFVAHSSYFSSNSG